MYPQAGGGGGWNYTKIDSSIYGVGTGCPHTCTLYNVHFCTGMFIYFAFTINVVDISFLAL